ncbi:LA_2272/LA_2273 family lipoprotein [Leptospira santarosai]
MIASWIFVGNCGVALTSETYVKVPPKTETEVFRLNLLYGEVDNLYGFNVGLYNHID